MGYRGKNVFLCNVHAPKRRGGKYIFFNYLNGLIEKWESDYLMGDFNTVFSRMDITMTWFIKETVGEKNCLN